MSPQGEPWNIHFRWAGNGYSRARGEDGKVILSRHHNFAIVVVCVSGGSSCTGVRNSSGFST